MVAKHHRIIHHTSTDFLPIPIPNPIKAYIDMKNISSSSSLVKPFHLFMLGLLFLAYISEARLFYVGGKEGWVQKPSEPYDQWAGRNRFQVNDSLVFVYNKTLDSVLVVTKEDHASCNTSSPIAKLDTGNDSFMFDRTGPFYFISGASGHCESGQKLTVVVLHISGGTSPLPSPSPSSNPPTSEPSASPPGGTMAAPPPSSGARANVGVAMWVALFVGAYFM